MKTREKLKKHFSDNKNVYIAIGVTTAVVGAGAYILYVKKPTQILQINPSIRYAAKQTGLSRSNIMKCLSGAVSSVDGHTFVSLGDMI